MRTPFSVRRTIRNTKRTAEMLEVFVRYGFQNIIQELKLDSLYQRGRKAMTGRRIDLSVERMSQPVRIRKAMEELGPTFVKLGQVLSMRPDLVPTDWADEFRMLQDHVPAVPFPLIRKRLEEEFPGRLGEMFQAIDPEPLAAASIAQVYRAVLRDGSQIVLKVLRPGVREILESDMEILHTLAGFMEDHFSNLGYSPTAVVEQFRRELQREVNLIEEARSTDRLRRDFADNPNVSFPKVYWEATTRSVLALEEIRGVLLSRLRPGELSEEELRCAVTNGIDAVFRQCLETGFFHADPHPGNIFVLPGGRICFIDCGMIGNVDPQTVQDLAELVTGVINVDMERVIEVTLSIADADPALAEDRQFRSDVWEYISHFQGQTLESLDVGHLLQEFFEKVRRNRLRVPSDIVFLIKAITTIEGVGEELLPQFNVVRHVRPHLERLVRRRYGYRAIRKRLTTSLLGYAETLENLPRYMRSAMFNLRRNQFTVNLEHRGLDRLTDHIEHASGNIAHAVFVASLIIGSSILVLADALTRDRGALTVVAVIGFIIAVVLAVIRVVTSHFKGR
jgi:ubiquinone biosynthesis protein